MRVLGCGVACAAACLLLAGCQGQAPAPTSTVPLPIRPAAAPLPSPSPGLAPSPSPVAAVVPSPSPSPSPTPVPLALDDDPFAVMIDNIAEARPHFGLGAADIVYEAPAEAGIPRLMPVFLRAGGEADRIGPVRSARHYFVELANEYRAPLVHIGASPQGFHMLSETGLPDVDEARGDGGFVRDRNRAAPHNAFVSTSSVREVLKGRGGPIKASTGGLSFGEYRAGTEPATTIKIGYSGPEGYSLAYDYDPDTKLYKRSMDGQPHTDGDTGDQYAARAILIELADVEPIPNDSASRVDVTLVGSGKGTLIAEGTQVPLQWTRANVHQATQYNRTDGAPFQLPNGQVWIQIVPLDAQISIS